VAPWIRPLAAPPTTAPAAPVKRAFTSDCQAFTNSRPNRIANKILLASNVVLGCTYYANRDGAPGLNCFEMVIQREMTDAIIYSGADFDSRYNDCLGRH
jgi:hypothetical protein